MTISSTKWNINVGDKKIIIRDVDHLVSITVENKDGKSNSITFDSSVAQEISRVLNLVSTIAEGNKVCKETK